MREAKISGRQLKQQIRQLLQSEDGDNWLDEIRRLPLKQAVSPLFSFLCSIDERVKWRAVTALGMLVSDLAASDMESARVVMRRFIWNLNDESGGIGWGCPESMAEVMAQNKRLAGEYGRILISYIQPEGNYLEHEVLQRGVLWGVGRLAHARPKYTRTIGGYLIPYMETGDPILRGLAAWAAGPAGGAESISQLKQLADDPSELMLYRNGKFDQYSVGQLAREALSLIYQVADAS
ncbi:MAG: HEAT repeat domain-containing protein [Proteobacteria bacterium]|nr:HEAT repeat domain-containing protein [Pseudomonadota bacterium]